MRVYPTTSNSKRIKNQMNSKQHNTNYIENYQQQKHNHHQQDDYDDDRALWSLPIKCKYFFAFILVTLLWQQNFPTAAAYAGSNSGLSDGVTKGFRSRMRSPKIASIHILQAVPESLPNNQHDNDGEPAAAAVSADNQTNAPAGKFEIRSVSGEPNYKSVNLTWEVEFVPADQDAITNSSREVEPPTNFQVFFCEIQSFGPHRCRSKVINGSTSLQIYDNVDNDLAAFDQIRQVRQFNTQVENLRMATKYSFHIRSTPKHRNMKVTGRSELFDNEIEGEDFLSKNLGSGQTIVVPTKGFSAQATRCLPTASEIEVETGPNFGGKIVVDGGNCGIKGNPSDAKDKYIMRIDHKICGSMVKPETNTVETFITVQENLGIFTHSTRRFVVVCSYHSGLQTVRASFSVPGRGGASAVHTDHYAEEERMGRGLKPMRYVDKSALVLKETETTDDNAASEETMAMVEGMDNPTINYNNTVAETLVTDDTTNVIATLENIIPGVNEEHIKQTEVEKNEMHNEMAEEQQESEIKHNAEYGNTLTTTFYNDYKNGNDEAAADIHDSGDGDDAHEQFSARYDKLTLQLNDRQPHAAEDDSDDFAGTRPTGRGLSSGVELITLSMGSVLLTVFLSVILIGIFVYVLYRETKLPPPMATAASSSSSDTSFRFHQHKQLQEVHTLPRSIRTKNQNSLA